jgi:selenocysteine lyase/cysteine desulfurase
MAGLVNFSVDGMTPQDVVTAVYDHGFIIRSVDTRPCTVSARASVGWWNTDEEIAGLTEAIAEIAASAKARAN